MADMTIPHRAKRLHAMPYEPLSIALVQGLAAASRLADGLVGANDDACHLPELLRVKGRLLLASPRPGGDEAEACFARSLELARGQGAPAWELRTAIDLAGLLADQGRSTAALTLLHGAYDKFAEGLIPRTSRPPSGSWRASSTSEAPSPVAHRLIFARRRAGVELARPADLLLGIFDHLLPLGDPADGARDREQDGEHRRSGSPSPSG